MKRRSQRGWWLIFGVGAAAVGLAMAWTTAAVLRLESAEAKARADAEQQGRLRLALWRMDSWLSPQLAREAARPYREYRPFYRQRRAWAWVSGEMRPREVLTPSPLLGFRSELFPLHFELRGDRGLSSPQVPAGAERELAERTLGATVDLAAKRGFLERVLALVEHEDLAERFRVVEARLPAFDCKTLADASEVVDRSQIEYQSRANATNLAKQSDGAGEAGLVAEGPARLGPLLPMWFEDGEGRAELLFLRRVTIGGETVFQGILGDWPRLRESLLDQAADLFARDAMELVRQESPTPEQQGRMLATVPASLRVPAGTADVAAWTPTRGVLAAAWLAVLAAAVAVGFTLRSAIGFGERRARFASAVTHELRTPLTTFRMYSEMLAENMVGDPGRRESYLRTLKREADRLSRLVENVLCYARLEDGRYRGRRERLSVEALLQAALPMLRQRAADGGMELAVEIDSPQTRVEVDPDAVAQILYNLVDNACKYASRSQPREIVVGARRRGDRVEISVRDHGPGIPAAYREAVFRAFERGGREVDEDTVAGVGLGLALSRGLARDLGGDLVLDPTVTDGARFVILGRCV